MTFCADPDKRIHDSNIIRFSAYPARLEREQLARRNPSAGTDKPLLLLAVLDLIKAGKIADNRIVPNTDLCSIHGQPPKCNLPGHIRQFAQRPMIVPSSERDSPPARKTLRGTESNLI